MAKLPPIHIQELFGDSGPIVGKRKRLIKAAADEIVVALVPSDHPRFEDAKEAVCVRLDTLNNAIREHDLLIGLVVTRPGAT